VEQAFLQAYIKAWKAYTQIAAGEQPAEQYLVIEEINRGNCAQIFGDLFQLLDRNRDGFSEYPITADKDMKKQLEKTFKGLEIADAERINKYYNEDMVSKVLSGEVLLLPDNLYIWATMNTSDQSLFPIDSAFKRRWEWKYIPISEGKTETGEKLGYKILIKGKKYDWWTFLNKINDEIEDTTKSEDKKLGYFFCKANDGIIDADTFVSKVVFYLWNDVFKDQDASIFSDDEGEMTFSKFYDTDIFGKPFVKEDKVVLLLQNLKVEPLSEDVVFDSDDDTASEEQESIRKESIISIQIPNNPKILAAETTQFDSFVKALKVIGIERILPLVDTLKYQRLNCPVISTIKYPAVENNDKGYSYYQEGALFIVKGCKSYTYVRILEDLNKALNIGLSIETK
jgi:5-methylcytosine-specific restriction endonuclease McrBC GTP-binding regulatory subunit McrB